MRKYRVPTPKPVLLQGPRPILRVLHSRRMHRGQSAGELRALQAMRDEIELREIWIVVHKDLGLEERVERLERECLRLREELRSADELSLGRRLARNGTPV